MPVDRAVRTARNIVACLAAAAALAGCEQGPVIDTTVKFDGQYRTISTADVTCTELPDGSLVILVDDGPRRVVRVHLSRTGQLVVHRMSLRYEEFSGFVADPLQVEVMKGDDRYTFRGRMPPNKGERDWHRFEVRTTCPSYTTPPPPKKARP